MHFKAPVLNKEFVVRTSRSGGSGGQNVNKVSTKVQIDFSVRDSALLSSDDKAILLEKLKDKLTVEGVLQVVSQTERTQLGNKEVALRKMYHILNKCFVVKKKRKPTKPSKVSIEKRLANKKHSSVLKQNRKYTQE